MCLWGGNAGIESFATLHGPPALPQAHWANESEERTGQVSLPRSIGFCSQLGRKSFPVLRSTALLGEVVLGRRCDLKSFSRFAFITRATPALASRTSIIAAISINCGRVFSRSSSHLAGEPNLNANTIRGVCALRFSAPNSRHAPDNRPEGSQCCTF